MDGDLNFHGQIKAVHFPAELKVNGDVMTVTGTANVSLTAYGIERPSLLLVPVEDTLRISFQMTFPGGGH